MVVKKQIAKVNRNKKIQNKQKAIPKKPVKVEQSDSEDNVSFDDMSEEELKKMLGNSSNSDLESEDFSEEEIKSTEAKVNKKRKLESEDEVEDNCNKKSKTTEVKKEQEEGDEIDSEDDDNEEDDSEVDDEEMEEDSFINDMEEEDEEEEEDEQVTVAKSAPKKTEVVTEKNVKSENTKKVETDYVKPHHNNENFQKIYEDTPKLESETLRKEISDRINDRRSKTLVLLNLPYKFNNVMAKELIPDMVSAIIPFDLRRHQIKGNAYIDVEKTEHVEKYCKALNGSKVKNNKITCFPFTKVDDNVDNYNCTRLVISNLPIKATTESLTRVMTKASVIRMMPLKRSDKKMTIVAFADYPCVEDAIFDYDNKHGVEFEGLPINVKFQSRSNTNVKKSIVAFNKKSLYVMGINKSISAADLKKLFPQAEKILWKVGDQIATINYENTEDCEVDYKNSFKNKPSKKMRIYYKMDMTQNPDKKKIQENKTVDDEKKTQENKQVEEKKNAASVQTKLSNQDKKKDNNRGNKKNFQSKPKFDKKKNSNGVKKENFKNSKNKTLKNLKAENESTKTINAQENQTIDKKIKEMRKASIEKIKTENFKNNSKTVENKKNNDGNVKDELVSKKNQNKRNKRLLKRKIKKEKMRQLKIKQVVDC